MIGKKEDKKLVDLEYMIPKEHKQEAGVTVDPHPIKRHEPEPEESVAQHFKELCYTCNKTSDEVVLMPVFHLGQDRWLCPSCLKSKMNPTPSIGSYDSSDSGYGGSNDGYGSSSYGGSDSGEYSSPMSMFD
jgi:hypothetical protein